MRVLGISVAPLFSDRIMGGSQRILIEAVDALAEAGHEVRVLCSDSGDSFLTQHNASVEASLELRGSFPAPFQTAPHRLTSVWNQLHSASRWADRAYLHADAIYMRSALGDLPVIRSLHDFVYEEALLSAFTLPADRTIVPSRYMRDCINASAGRVYDVGEVTVVPNGVASPTWPIVPALPPNIEGRQSSDLILLHPHRLHREKGIEESILIASEVQKRLPDRRVRLLVPALQPGGSADDADLAAASIGELAEASNASNLLELHEWLPPELMPQYFASGDVTLCPGSFVESFGLTPLESVVAGTPAVCARVGAFREQAGLSGITHFDYGDISAGADAVVEAVSGNTVTSEIALEIARRYDLNKMRSAYVEAITGALPSAGPKDRQVREPQQQATWKLAPWCYISGQRIYHDYLARFETLPVLAELLATNAAGLSEAALSGGVSTSELELARKLGFLVPA